jgi:hypothetical protein
VICGMFKTFSCKKLVMLVFLCFVSTLVAPYAYIVEYTDHDCEGEDCHVCLQIAYLQNNLQKLGLGVIHITPSCIAFFASAQLMLAERVSRIKSTNPILLKVKLNN